MWRRWGNFFFFSFSFLSLMSLSLRLSTHQKRKRKKQKKISQMTKTPFATTPSATAVAAPTASKWGPYKNYKKTKNNKTVSLEVFTSLDPSIKILYRVESLISLSLSLPFLSLSLIFVFVFPINFIFSFPNSHTQLFFVFVDQLFNPRGIWFSDPHTPQLTATPRERKITVREERETLYHKQWVSLKKRIRKINPPNKNQKDSIFIIYINRHFTSPCAIIILLLCVCVCVLCVLLGVC